MKRIFKSAVSLLMVAVLLCGALPAGFVSAAVGSNQHVSVAETYIVATKDVSLTLPFDSDGSAGNVTRVAQANGSRINVFALQSSGSYGYFTVGNKTAWGSSDTMAYCIEPGVLTGWDVDYTGATSESTTNSFYKSLYNSARTNEKHEAILKGIYRMNAVADAYNTSKNTDIQAIAGILMWEIIGGLRDPLTGELYSNSTSLQSSFTSETDSSAYNSHYKQLLSKYQAFSKICSFLYERKSDATANPYVLEWNATNQRYEITLTDHNNLLSYSSVNFSEVLDGCVQYSRGSSTVTLYTETPIDGIVTSTKITKPAAATSITTSSTPSCIVYGGMQLNGNYAQALVTDGIPDPPAGFLAVRTGDRPLVNVTGSKKWNDDDDSRHWRPDEITVRLWANGTEINSQTVTADANGNWTWAFNSLDQFDTNGAEISYTVTEDPIQGYSATVNGYNITNAVDPIVIGGTKFWDDDNDRDGKRPNEIMLAVLADGEPYKFVYVNKYDDWKWELEVPRCNAEGKEIVWTITEPFSTTYAPTYDGLDVTNTLIPEAISNGGVKTWSDSGDQDGLRPDEITIRLWADGVEIDHKVVTEDENGEWTWEWTDLPKYRDGGVLIEYAITEDPIPGYETYIDGFDVINTHVPETTTVSGVKTWDDASDQDGLRADEITVMLYKDGELYDFKAITADENGDWSWEWTGLPKYRDHGVEIVWEIKEMEVSGYETVINGYDITNIHIPAETTVSGVKTWDDASNQDGLRADEITVRLWADGVEIDHKTVTEDENGEWTWTWTDLPK